jgi:hypothetical protein
MVRWHAPAERIKPGEEARVVGKRAEDEVRLLAVRMRGGRLRVREPHGAAAGGAATFDVEAKIEGYLLVSS